jgi:hypothetical protein
VSGFITGATATQTGVTPTTGKTGQFYLPSQTVTSGGNSGNQTYGGSCNGWAFGKTDTNNVTADVSAGLPKAPSNVDSGSPFNYASGFISRNSGGGCGLLSYDNTISGGLAKTSADATGFEMGATPYVQSPDVTGSGAAISGAGYVTSNPLPTSPQQTKAGATASMASAVVLFPNNPESTFNATFGSKGLVAAILDSGSVDCVSGSGGLDGTVVGKYTLRMFWWGRGTADAAARWHAARWTYDSGSGSSPVLTAGSDTWDPTNTLLGNGLRLSDLVSASGVTPNVVTSGATNGLRGFANGIFTLTTAPTLTNEPGVGFSAINVQLGQLSCVADDQR